MTASTAPPPVGLVLGSEIPPARLGAMAARAEAAGLGELWLSEDYFMTSAASSRTRLSPSQH